MKISRRNFLSSVTAWTGTLSSMRLMGLDWFDSRPEPELHCLVLDLQSHCVLRESLHGYQAALAGEYHCRKLGSIHGGAVRWHLFRASEHWTPR